MPGLPALDAALARAHHLLVLPDGVDPADVEALVLSRFPESAVSRSADRVRLEPVLGCAVSGPWAAPAQLVPGWAAAVFTLEAPVQRGPAVPRELQGRGDLLDAFADGEPVGRERELIEFGLAAARRLGGAIRASGSGMLMTPDHRVDLVVYSPVWLHPDALVHVLERHLPGVSMPAVDAGAALPADAVTGRRLIQDEGERRWLAAEAAAYDAAALEEVDVTESYGAVARADDAVFSIAVEAARGVPVVLSGIDLAGLIIYELRCYTDGSPTAAAVARLDAAGRALVAAVGGHVVDDDGFLVDLG